MQAASNHNDLASLRLKLYFESDGTSPRTAPNDFLLHTTRSPKHKDLRHKSVRGREGSGQKKRSPGKRGQHQKHADASPPKPYVYQIRRLDAGGYASTRSAPVSIQSLQTVKMETPPTPAPQQRPRKLSDASLSCGTMSSDMTKVNEWMRELPTFPTMYPGSLDGRLRDSDDPEYHTLRTTTPSKDRPQQYIHEKSHAKHFNIPNEGSLSRMAQTTQVASSPDKNPDSLPRSISLSDTATLTRLSDHPQPPITFEASDFERPLPSPPTPEVEPAHLMIGKPGYETQSRRATEVIAVLPRPGPEPPTPPVRKRPTVKLWRRDSSSTLVPTNSVGEEPKTDIFQRGRNLIKGFFEPSQDEASVVTSPTIERESRRGRSSSRATTPQADPDPITLSRQQKNGAYYWSKIKGSVSSMSHSMRLPTRGRSTSRTPASSPKCEAKSSSPMMPFSVASSSRPVRGRTESTSLKKSASKKFGIGKAATVFFRSRSVPAEGRSSSDEKLWQVVCNYADIRPERGRRGTPRTATESILSLFEGSSHIADESTYPPLPLHPTLSTAGVPFPQFPTLSLHPSILRLPGRARFSFESDRIDSIIDGSVCEIRHNTWPHSNHHRASVITSTTTSTSYEVGKGSNPATFLGTGDRVLNGVGLFKARVPVLLGETGRERRNDDNEEEEDDEDDGGFYDESELSYDSGGADEVEVRGGHHGERIRAGEPGDWWTLHGK
ncbi:hypothetical protein HDU67_002168 [Dinochytrium kinnereticum]|nr:hypothetical protein HDU67_002168 [Dinochytrium kinnereticum]